MLSQRLIQVPQSSELHEHKNHQSCGIETMVALRLHQTWRKRSNGNLLRDARLYQKFTDFEGIREGAARLIRAFTNNSRLLGVLGSTIVESRHVRFHRLDRKHRKIHRRTRNDPGCLIDIIRTLPSPAVILTPMTLCLCRKQFATSSSHGNKKQVPDVVKKLCRGLRNLTSYST